MHNYLYISDAKVDAYIGQIGDKEKRKIAARLGVNVGVFQAEVGAEWMSQSNRVIRLEVVEQRLLKEKSVGSLESGEPWIEGAADVVPATFRGEKSNLLFFFTPDQDHFLGLAGSAHHAIGAVRAADAVHSLSHLHSLLDMLEGATDHQPYVLEKSDEALSAYLHAGVSRIPGGVSDWTQIMSDISTQFNGRPRQRVSFLARRLTSDSYGADGRQYTLATPLYMTVDDDVA